MKRLKMTLSSFAVALLVCSCGKKNSSGTDNPEQLMPDKQAQFVANKPEQLLAEYRKCREAGGEGLVNLVYKSEEIPDDFRQEIFDSMLSNPDMTIDEITLMVYDDSDDEERAEGLKGLGLKMPVKPTHSIKISFEEMHPGVKTTSYVPMAKVDGSYYLIVPIKAE